MFAIYLQFQGLILDSPCKMTNANAKSWSAVTFPKLRLGVEEQNLSLHLDVLGEILTSILQNAKVTYRNYKAVKIQNKNNFLLKQHHILVWWTIMCLLQEWRNSFSNLLLHIKQYNFPFNGGKIRAY